MLAALGDFWHTMTLPTMLPFSVLLAIAVLYWFTVILGALDLNILDFDVDGAEAGVDGGLEGQADGMLDGDAGGVLDGHDHGTEGLAASAEGLFNGILRFLSIGQVPVTIVLSIFIVVMWVVAFVWHMLFGGWMLAALPVVMAMVVTLLVVGFLALLATGWLTRPMRKLFVVHTQHGNEYLIGKTCVVRTTQVTASAGQAELRLGQAQLVIDVRCEGENGLGKGSEAVIVDYSPDRKFYSIKPL